MRGQGDQLRQITTIIESGVIKPIMDKVFPVEQTNDAMSYIEQGMQKGKLLLK